MTGTSRLTKTELLESRCKIFLKLFFAVLAAMGVSCGGSSDKASLPEAPAAWESGVRQVFRQNSPYAEQLLECTELATFEDSCLLSKLPFIGNGIDTPSVDQIMDRVIATEYWMGVRFESILQRAPLDVRLLLSSVTSIELDGDSPGNIYRIWSGGLKMSAQPLWITEAEKNTVDLTVVSENGFATQLSLRHAWSNNRAGTAYDEFNRRTKSLLWNGARDIDQIYHGFLDGLYLSLIHI